MVKTLRIDSANNEVAQAIQEAGEKPLRKPASQKPQPASTARATPPPTTHRLPTGNKPPLTCHKAKKRYASPRSHFFTTKAPDIRGLAFFL
jgi:hypothetical protein